MWGTTDCTKSRSLHEGQPEDPSFCCFFGIRTIEMWLQEDELALFEHRDLRLSTQMQKSLSCETESLCLK